MRFTRADVRDLAQNAQRYLATRRKESGGTGFADMHRQALVRSLRAYFDSDRSEAAARLALDGFVRSGRGPTPRKESMARLLTPMLTKFAAWDNIATDTLELYLDPSRVDVPWRGHDLSIARDIVVVTTAPGLRCVWTDSASRLARRGTGLLVAAHLAHAEGSLSITLNRVEVWHLREPEPRIWRRPDLIRSWDTLERRLNWAAAALRSA